MWRAQFIGVCVGTIYSGIPKSDATKKKAIIANKDTLENRLALWDKFHQQTTVYGCLDPANYAEHISPSLLTMLLEKIDPADRLDGARWYLLPSGEISDLPGNKTGSSE